MSIADGHIADGSAGREAGPAGAVQPSTWLPSGTPPLVAQQLTAITVE